MEAPLRQVRRGTLIICWLLAAIPFLAACTLPSPPATTRVPSAGAVQATRVATATPQGSTLTPSPPPTATATVTRRPAASTRTPITSSTTTPSATPGPAASPSQQPSQELEPFPSLIARIPLAPTGASLVDLLLDRAAGRLYVTDTAGQLHVLDAETYDELATLRAAGTLTLDAPRSRLYASPPEDMGAGPPRPVTIVDTDALTVFGTIEPGGLVAVDSQRDRFYVGNPTYGPADDTAAGVRVYQGSTLSQVGEVPQPGIPVYNPIRDELYVVSYTVHTADPESLQVTGDLLPEIEEQVPPWCNGCTAATGAQVFPDQNLLVVEVTLLSAGKGPGVLPSPRFFDATSLDEIVDLADIPPVERGCQERLMLAEPVGTRIYRDQRYSRYVFYSNLLVYDFQGELQTWRDGLSLGITNPNTGQMYVPRADEALVLDLASLALAGTVPLACIHTLDAEAGRFYAQVGPDLLVYAETGGQPAVLPPAEPGSLPEERIVSILPSPDHERDGTLYLTTDRGKAYRSVDRGETWAQLRGGLPEGNYLTLDLAISPDFSNLNEGQPRTLFAGGYHREFWGEGVYRSLDAGDSWEPMWQDLMHLRVYDVALSPDYAADGTLLAYNNYQRLEPWQGGASVSRSTDRGLSWTLVMTKAQVTDLPPPEVILPAAFAAPTIQFRRAGYGRGVERSLDRGATWEPLTVTRQPDFYVQAVLKSPTFARDRTVYVLSEFDLFRSTDAGESWQAWRDNRLAGRDYIDKLTTANLSAVAADDSHQIFVGTAAGEAWAVDPEQLTWEPVEVAAQWPTVLAGEWVGQIALAPDGSLWLGTWGHGLAHYAAGAIQARYTVTDGLSSQYIGGLDVALDGTVWAGGDLPPGLASFDGERWRMHDYTDSDGAGAIRAIEVAPDNSVWIGAQAPGLFHGTGEAWQWLEDPENLTGWRINDLKMDAAGTLWCATAGGLVFYRQGTWTGEGGQEAIAIDLGPENVAFLLNSDASVWRYSAGGWTQLPPLQEGLGLSGLALHAAADGAVWVGTHEGAFRYDGQDWQQFTAQDGLPANSVSAISEDAEGQLWFGTESGAAHVELASLGLSPVRWPQPPTPTPEPQATATSTPRPPEAPTPMPCSLTPAPPFAPVYDEADMSSILGCPAAPATETGAAFQPFEQGLMFWRADEQAIYVLNADGTWAHHIDTWDTAQPPYDPSLTAPQGLQQPVRGFGKVWREQLGGPQAELGWALAGEQPYTMLWQPFFSGQMLLGPGQEVYILYAGLSWERKE